ncbi:hypothetical protein [Chryseobacterium chendengshani]|uniref:hypothetical protein n=1 Tax=Chryseobacterium sp. LJ756 TaxID=2864113 RepID=UPI001C640E20|nr:hypothetical protein [Chryseobacterium sp. LJ756]MBW7674141.1 hypothetical protein [Chryseobacterium sp. LJ756]
MKLSILIFSLFFVGCKSQTSNYDSLYAYVKRTDSTSHNYILHLEKNKEKIIVPIFKDYDNKNSYPNKLRIGKKYKFILVKESYTKTQDGFLKEIVDDTEIWNSDIKSTRDYPDCQNVCGLFIK